MKKYLIYILTILILNCQTVEEKKTAKYAPKSTAKKIFENFKGEYSNPETHQTMYIHNFKNRSSKVDFPARLRQKLQIIFNSDGNISIENNKKNASVWLYGDILNYQKIPLNYNEFGRVIKFRIFVLMQVKLKMNPAISNETLLGNRIVRFDTNYVPTEQPYESEFSVQERLLDGLTDRVVYTVLNGWYTKLKTEEELNQEKIDFNLLKKDDDIIRKDLPLELQKNKKVKERK